MATISVNDAEQKDMLTRKGAVPSGVIVHDPKVPAVGEAHDAASIVEKAAK